MISQENNRLENQEWAEMPEGWGSCYIKDVVTVNPKKIEADPESITGFVPMSHAPTGLESKLAYEERTWGEIQKKYTNFKDGDVIFAKVTPCFENGKAAIVDGLPNGIGAGSSEFYVLRPNHQLVKNTIIFSLIKTFQFAQAGASSMTGAVGLRRVPRKFVENYRFSLPPLAEQQEIARQLDILLAQVEHTQARLQRIPDILKRFRQSVLADAVNGKLTEEWRGDIFETNKYPATWKLQGLSEIGELARGKSRHRPRNDPALFGTEYPFIQTGEVANSNGLITNATKFYSEFGLKQSRLFPKNTLCITIAANIADTAILDIDACFPDSVVGFTPDKKAANVLFIKYLIDVNKNNLEAFAPATAQKNINLKILNEMRIPIPPLEEQSQIVARVEQLFAYADRIEQQAGAALERVNLLSQSILAKAFRGELTADWRANNPDLISGENSAEALLAKIQVEKKLAKAKKP